MVQEFCVLRCFKCETFQVQIVKKSKKWDCKMCGVKQSVKQIYGKGTSKDCRQHTQKLNELRIIGDFSNANTVDSEMTFSSNNTIVDNPNNNSQIITSNSKVPNKWNKYIDEETVNKIDDDNDDVVDGVRYVLNIPQNKKKRKSSTGYINVKKVCLNLESNDHQNFNTDTTVECSINENYIQTDSQPAICNDSLEDITTYNINQHEKNKPCDENKRFSTFKEKPIDKNNKWAKYIEDSDDSNAEKFEDISICHPDKNTSFSRYSLQQNHNHLQETSRINNETQNTSRKLFDVFDDDDSNLDEVFNI